MRLGTAIGDLQGCAAALDSLLPQCQPPFWFCGDLVNRGPDSLACLRRVKQLCETGAAVCVLGNHDLHLLAVAAGVRQRQEDDTLSDILSAPDRDVLLDWLRQQPLAYFRDEHLLIHAGVLPCWTAEQTLHYAIQAQMPLRGSAWREYLQDLYGSAPMQWDDALTGIERLRVIVNALTRLRFCTPEGTMDLHTKEAPDQARAGYLPWFEVPERKTAEVTVVFGHWSALGLVVRPNVVGLDTGCVWGGQLTGVTLSTTTLQRQVVQVSCPPPQPQARD